MTLIARSTAQRLIRQGKAAEDCIVRPDPSSDRRFVAITRYDVQRIDHYAATDADVERVRQP